MQAREIIDGVPGDDESTVTTAEASVTIKDVNDEPPSFNRREYNIEIPENVPDGTPLPHLDMIVKDPDVVRSILHTPISHISQPISHIQISHYWTNFQSINTRLNSISISFNFSVRLVKIYVSFLRLKKVWIFWSKKNDGFDWKETIQWKR